MFLNLTVEGLINGCITLATYYATVIFSVEWIGIAILKIGAQPILDPNDNRNRNLAAGVNGR